MDESVASETSSSNEILCKTPCDDTVNPTCVVNDPPYERLWQRVRLVQFGRDPNPIRWKVRDARRNKISPLNCMTSHKVSKQKWSWPSIQMTSGSKIWTWFAYRHVFKQVILFITQIDKLGSMINCETSDFKLSNTRTLPFSFTWIIKFISNTILDCKFFEVRAIKPDLAAISRHLSVCLQLTWSFYW